MTILAFAGRLLAALLFGSVIGLERQWRHRQAGLRTNALVAVAAAAFVSLSLLIPEESASTRIASYVVSGIGFLGTGVILKEGRSVTGLNTAATLWCVAAVGVLTGWGFLLHALFTTTVVVLAHVILRPLAYWVETQPQSAREEELRYVLSLVCWEEQERLVRMRLVEELEREGLVLSRLSSENLEGTSHTRVEAEVRIWGKGNRSIERVVNRPSLIAGVSLLSWNSDDNRGAD